MKIHPYLVFDGNCRKAMSFYHECFGGELRLMRVSETPLAVHFPAEFADKTVHGSIVHKHFTLMASDSLGGSADGENKSSLFLNLESQKELHHFFVKLSAEGTVQMEPHQTFWGATYAECIDRFGVHWKLNHVKNN